METGADQEGLSLCLLFFDENRCSQVEGELMRVYEGRRPWLLLLLRPDEFRSWCRRAASM